MSPENIIEPSKESVKSYNIDFYNTFHDEEKSIDILIKTFPLNNSIEHVLLKVCVINKLYTTNIYDVKKLAKHILKQKIDSKLQEGVSDTVDTISKGHKIGNPEKRFYSFATKYCHFHNPEAYPIYDSYVEKAL